MAMKRYTCSSTQIARADWEKEWKNNVTYGKHPHIIPIQASIAHGEVYMNFYSLCDGDLQALFSKDPKPTDHGAEFVWRQYMGLLSALDHIHESIPEIFGYHFDIKTPNILVRMEKWMIADLGRAHRKDKIDADFDLVQRKNNEIATSKTKRRSGCMEFGGPETTVNRKFDVWGMACVGCITFAWLRKGAKGVKQFREDRRQEIPGELTTVLYNFYRQGPGDPQLHPAVEKLLSEATDDLSKGVAGILRDMLSIKVDDRPTAQQAEKRFAKLLGVAPLKVLKPPERSMSEFVPQGPGCPSGLATDSIVREIRGESSSTKPKAVYVRASPFLRTEMLDMPPAIVKSMEKGFPDQPLAGSEELDSNQLIFIAPTPAVSNCQTGPTTSNTSDMNCSSSNLLLDEDQVLPNTLSRSLVRLLEPGNVSNVLGHIGEVMLTITSKRPLDDLTQNDG